MTANANDASLERIARLLSNKSMQDELNLTSDQEANLRAAIGDIRQKLARDMEENLSEILTQEQHKRFKEIRVQVLGFQAFGDVEVQAQLHLTDEQREQLREILREGFQEAKPIRKSLGRVKKETMAKAMAVLADKQKSKWDEIQGKSFDLKQEAVTSERQADRAMAGKFRRRRERMNLWEMPDGADTEMQAGTGAGMTRRRLRIQAMRRRLRVQAM